MASHFGRKPFRRFGHSLEVTVHRWLLIVLLPPLLLAQTSDERIEDSGASTDGEASLPDDSLYRGNLPPLKPGVSLPGSTGISRVRFTNSYAVSRSGSEQVHWSDIWSRLRLTVQSRSDFRTDVLAVRRVNDPQTLDELHLTVSGMHAQTEIKYTVGTYQLDWGFGSLTSAAYGSAREFSHTSTFVPHAAQGVVARPTSREGTWLRGLAMERRFERVRLSVFASQRPWNAETENDKTHLTGVIQPTSSIGLARRDQIDEQLLGLGAKLNSEYFELAALAQQSHFSTELESIGSNLRQFTVSGSALFKQLASRAEFARSGSETAWQVLLSGMTGAWRCTAYASYAVPGYFAPRSQSPESFGEQMTNESTLGVRAGFVAGRHRFTGDVRDLLTPAATATIGPSRQSTEAELNWAFDFTDAGELSTRIASGSREEHNADEVIDRNYQRLRLILNWQRGLLWSIRVEDHRSRDVEGTNPSAGSYQHFQVSLAEGAIQPGVRMAFFSIPSTEGPLLIYEPSISGAYPLTSFSSDGRHLAAWLSIVLDNWNTRLKASLTERSGNSKPDTNVGLELNFRY